MKKSSGILLYRKNVVVEVFLVHPGGPFWKNKDVGVWSVPKGEFAGNEDALSVAIREFKEETGSDVNGTFRPLTPVKQKGGKMVYAWYIEGNIDENSVCSNLVPVQWPPGSGRIIQVPEIDKGAWFTIELARQKINPARCL